MKISIDEDICCGSGMCALNAPEVFDQRADDGIVVALTETPAASSYDAVRAAVAACPTQAISLAE